LLEEQGRIPDPTPSSLPPRRQSEADTPTKLGRW
jgi:hypothetical protein